MKLETLLAHASDSQPQRGSAIAAPIVLSTTFQRNPDGTYEDDLVYTRSGNPSRHALENLLPYLEQINTEAKGPARAFAFASGMAAVSALLHTLRPGDHIVLPDDLYHGTRHLVQQVLADWHIEHSIVDMRNLPAVRAAVRAPQTRMVWLETPSNPSLKVTDIRAVAGIAHEVDALVVVDNTWMTPILQQPLNLGADVVMYSTSKYFGGHSDLLGGALIIAPHRVARLGESLRRIQALAGGVPSPFDCWLMLRSLPTMSLRVRQQSTTAARLATWLSAHPMVHTVYYPGLPSHPDHALARQQAVSEHFGAMLSFRVRGGAEAARLVASQVRLIAQATSLGGVESLIEHRASVEGPGTPTPDDLLRFSVGLEDADDLTADLAQALAALPA